jgi:predicted permease
MSILRVFLIVRLRVRALFAARQLDHEMDDELRFHLDREIDAGMARGLPAADARRHALTAMGGLQPRREEIRDTRGLADLWHALRDARIAVRMIRRRPGFATVVILTLALGLGGTTAMFAVVNGVLLQPLPFDDPDRLVLLSSAPRDSLFGRALGLAEQQFVEVRAGNQTLEHVALFASRPANITGAGEPLWASLGTVTTEFFSVLRARAALGRTIAPGDDDPARDPVVVLSDRLWRAHLAADPQVLGRAIKIDGRAHQIVGVMPAGFTFPDEVQGWIPLDVQYWLQSGNSLTRPAMGRLKSRVTIEQARAELALLAPGPDTAPEADNWRIVVLPLKERAVGQVREPLAILAGAVGLVMLVSCGNVASLFLIHAARRRREIDVRIALGAGRGRLIRQLLVEGGLMALLSGALSLLVASWAVPGLLSLAPARAIPRVDLIRIDASVAMFTLALAVITTLGFALLPALRATRRDSLARPTGRTSTERFDGLHTILIVAEVALAVVLLTGAGLMMRTFLNLRAVETGFNAEDVLTVTVDLPQGNYATAERAQQFQRDALDRLRVVPAVDAVGVVNWLPFGTAVISGDFALDAGRPVPADLMVDKPVVSAGYFQSMGIRLLKGRDFSDGDSASAQPVAVVSRSAAAVLWPGEEAIGQRISLRSEPRPADWLTVVGVVEDVRQQSLTGDVGRAVYQSYQQVPRLPFLTHLTFVVRAAGDPAGLAPAIRTAMGGVDAELPVPSVVPMRDILATRIAGHAFQTRLLSIFALAALILTAIGIYGVLAYSVSQRTRELAIRFVLGAGPWGVLGTVARRTLLLVGTGVALGTAGAVALTRVLRGHLFAVTPTDPIVFGTAAASLMAAALVAAAIPAWRATRVDPTLALKED